MHGDEHHCDGVWIDLDAVLDAAGEGLLDQAARVAASVGATGLIGESGALERTRIPDSLGTLHRGMPEDGSAWDLALVDDPSRLEEASAWSARTGGQLVVSEQAVRCVGAEGRAGIGAPGAVTAIWSEDAEGEALDLVRSSEGWTGFHGGLEFAGAYRAGAGALAGPIPLLHPALAVALHELCRTDVARALGAERQLARWVETSLLPACRSAGLERPALGRAAIGIGGWLRSDFPIPGEKVLELRRQLIGLAASFGLAQAAEALDEAV